ncbi:hypothetical protein SB11R_00190 [Pseudomonas oryzihabitans]|nr:hypothetical protein SB11R_00190 [Pseudomonas psychrotolerans]
MSTPDNVRDFSNTIYDGFGIFTELTKHHTCITDQAPETVHISDLLMHLSLNSFQPLQETLAMVWIEV